MDSRGDLDILSLRLKLINFFKFKLVLNFYSFVTRFSRKELFYSGDLRLEF